MANHIDLLSKAVAIATHYGNGQEQRISDNEFMTCCPIHSDNTPSFHVTVTDRILVKCMAGCDQRDVIEKIKKDGLWPAAPGPTNNGKPYTNVPPHKIPDWDSVHLGTTKPSAIYTYTDQDNNPWFWVLRLDTPKGKNIRPYSSVHDPKTGKDTFEFKLDLSNRPMYNLYSLVKRPEVPVLVLEGEKACDAAQERFPEYVCVSWSGGTGGVAKTDFSPLAKRKVTLVPDNDDAGIKAMVKVATLVKAENEDFAPMITFMDVQDDVPKGWDFADEFDADLYSPEYFLGKSVKFDYERFNKVDLSTDGSEYVDFYNKKYVAIAMPTGDVSYYNIQKVNPNSLDICPYLFIKNETALRAHERETVYDVTREKYMRKIDYWLEDPNRQVLDGFTYDIENTSKIIGNKLNTFMGFYAKPGKGDKYKPLIDHIYHVLPKDQADYLIDWFAQMVQSPQSKPGTMIILTGEPGTGKTIIGEVIVEMFGYQSAVAVETSAFTNSSFNQMFASKVFVLINEFEVAKKRDHKFMAQLKAYVTDSHFTVNPKGSKQYSVKSHHRYFATTNSNSPIGIDSSDRRYVMLEVENDKAEQYAYFAPIYDMKNDKEALDDLFGYFMRREITSNINRPIETKVREDNILFEDPVEDIIYTIAQTGSIHHYISNQLMLDEIEAWMAGDANLYIPRRVFAAYILDYLKIDKTAPALANILKKYLPYSMASNINNTRRMHIRDSRGNIEDVNERVWQIPPINELRQTIEQIKKRKYPWQDLGVKPSNEKVIEFKKKEKDPF